MNHVEFYLLQNGNIQHHLTGDHQILNRNDLAAYPVFEFFLKQNQEATLFIKIHTDRHVSFPFRFYSAEQFGAKSNRTLVYQIVYLFLLFVYLIFQVRFNPSVNGRWKFFSLLPLCVPWALYLLLFMGAIQALRHKSFYVIYLLGSWFLTFGATIGLTFMLFDWIPYNFITQNGILLAFPFEIGFIALSLIQRKRTLKQEHEKLNRRLNDLMTSSLQQTSPTNKTAPQTDQRNGDEDNQKIDISCYHNTGFMQLHCL